MLAFFFIYSFENKTMNNDTTAFPYPTAFLIRSIRELILVWLEWKKNFLINKETKNRRKKTSHVRVVCLSMFCKIRCIRDILLLLLMDEIVYSFIWAILMLPDVLVRLVLCSLIRSEGHESDFLFAIVTILFFRSFCWFDFSCCFIFLFEYDLVVFWCVKISVLNHFARVTTTIN